jgi:hypothetical protein
MELYLHSPNMPSWRGAQLKHRENFTLHLENLDKYYLRSLKYVYFKNEETETAISLYTSRAVIAQSV